MFNSKFLPLLFVSSLALISCGGSGGGDNDSDVAAYNGLRLEASVTSDNGDSLAVAATAGANQSIVEGAAQGAAFRPSPVLSLMLGFSNQLKNYLTTANRTANQPLERICSGGSVDATSNQDGTKVTMVFSNCVVIDGNGEVVNGRVIVTSDQAVTNFTMQFIDFTVIYLGETYAMNMTIQCDNFGCTWSSDFSGPDGRIYRTENAVVYFSGGAYSVNATVYDPDYGYITINANVTYGSCAGGVPQSGSINFTGASGSSGSITLNGCENFTVTVDGVSELFFWSDYLI